MVYIKFFYWDESLERELYIDIKVYMFVYMLMLLVLYKILILICKLLGFILKDVIFDFFSEICLGYKVSRLKVLEWVCGD